MSYDKTLESNPFGDHAALSSGDKGGGYYSSHQGTSRRVNVVSQVPPIVQYMEKIREKAEFERRKAGGSQTAKQKAESALSYADRVRVWMINEGTRRFFVITFLLLNTMVFSFGFLHYRLKDTLVTNNAVFGLTFPIARSAALVLHVDVSLILLPVCRTLISRARRSRLNGSIPFDKNITFHKLVGWSIFIFSWVHTIAHWNNLAQFAIANKVGLYGFFLANFATGPGWTGYVMLFCLTAMVMTSLKPVRNENFERFWYTHHLFIFFFLFWSIHGAFCMIKPDFPPFCGGIGVFWQYWLLGGFVYLAERLAREKRGRMPTEILKVLQHADRVMEVRILMKGVKSRPGQYIFICCPAVSLWQYHPFTLTSSPEDMLLSGADQQILSSSSVRGQVAKVHPNEGFISVHIRCHKGGFTSQLSTKLGCVFDDKDQDDTIQPISNKKSVSKFDKTESGNENTVAVNNVQTLLPRLYIDGPFGSASEDVFNYRTVILVGAGIGVTPFASILRHIWYRFKNRKTKSIPLEKVYFVWTARNFKALSWFRDLLREIEREDTNQQIELLIHLTGKLSEEVINTLQLNDEDPEDPITSLRTRTIYKRPVWEEFFPAVKERHRTEGEVGVFFCGPKVLSSTLHVMCNRHSEGDFSFIWSKENF